jgi:hypothetical protein
LVLQSGDPVRKNEDWKTKRNMKKGGVEETYTKNIITDHEEYGVLGCYAVRFLQEPHGVTSKKTAFFIVTAGKTSNLTL